MKLGRTIRKHAEGILAYLDTKMTNGPVEGINNKLRVIARRAYGFHSPGALISTLFLCCGGIELAPPTTHTHLRRLQKQMDTEEVIGQATHLQARIRQYAQLSEGGLAAKAQVCEFLRNYAGARNAFLQQAEAARGVTTYLVRTLDAIIKAFIEYLEAGLATGVSPETPRPARRCCRPLSHAAHGEWDRVSDRDRIRLMLEGDLGVPFSTGHEQMEQDRAPDVLSHQRRTGGVGDASGS